MSARAVATLVVATLVVGCNQVLGIGDPETDLSLSSAPWPTRGTSAPGPAKWVPQSYEVRSETGAPEPTPLRFSTTQKAYLLSQMPPEIDACAPCAEAPKAGFVLRVYTDGAFADRLETCDALINCLGTALSGKKLEEAPNQEIFVRFLPR